MSYIRHEFYSVECDHPGCGKKLSDFGDEDIWQFDPDDADFYCHDYYDWQTVDDENPTRHYCPDHYHAKCCKCGAEEIGSRKQLDKKGWVEEWDRDFSLCPKCAMEEK